MNYPSLQPYGCYANRRLNNHLYGFPRIKFMDCMSAEQHFRIGINLVTIVIQILIRIKLRRMHRISFIIRTEIKIIFVYFKNCTKYIVFVPYTHTLVKKRKMQCPVKPNTAKRKYANNY